VGSARAARSNPGVGCLLFATETAPRFPRPGARSNGISVEYRVHRASSSADRRQTVAALPDEEAARNLRPFVNVGFFLRRPKPARPLTWPMALQSAHDRSPPSLASPPSVDNDPGDLGRRSGFRLWQDQFPAVTRLRHRRAGLQRAKLRALTPCYYYWTMDQGRIVPRPRSNMFAPRP